MGTLSSCRLVCGINSILFFPEHYAKKRFLNVFVTADRTFSWFSQSFPLFEPESAFFTFSRNYHQALSAFPECYPDMPEMINNFFFRNPNLCGYLSR